MNSHDLQEHEILSLSLFGEARGEPIEGIIGVGWVIKNRLKAWRRYRATEGTYRGICLAPMQFSCWNAGSDINHLHLLAVAARLAVHDPPTDLPWRECAWIAEGLMTDRLRDPSRGATHYLTTALYEETPPRWATRLQETAVLGHHTFLVEPPERSLDSRTVNA